MLDQKSILIVEDNVFLAIDLAMAVEDLGGSVIGPVGRVDEAMLLLDRHPISGAVLDSQLEDRDITPIVMCLVEQGVPLVIHTGTGLPPGLARSHPDLPVLVKPLKPAIVLEILMDRMRERNDVLVANKNLG
jgi:AmiR/NasT family two-component response regulator